MAYEEYQSEKIDQLLLALGAVQKNLPRVAKNKSAPVGKNGSGRRYYADLQSVIDASQEPMEENGLQFTWQIFGNDERGWPVLYVRLHHLPSGQWMASEYHAMTDTMGGTQGQGSAITYGRRYTYVTMLGIVPDDDDGEAAQRGFLARKVQARQEERDPAPAQSHAVSYRERGEQAKADQERRRRDAVANNPDPPSAELRREFIAAVSARCGGTNDAAQFLSFCSMALKRNILDTHEITAAEMRSFLGK